MDRRTFILKTAVWALGTIFAECGFRRHVFACPNRASAGDAKPRIAIIIDDIGYRMKQVMPFLTLNIPLTFSILPRLRHSRHASEYIHAHNHEIMLHQPMEPFNTAIDPGPGALFVGDDPSAIQRTINLNLDGVPHAVGTNNHMGSKFTAHRRDMETAIHAIKQHRLFFVDSLTSSRSVGYRQAVQNRLNAACRNIFLDHYRCSSAIMTQLTRLKTHALIHGRAIAIGHPYPQTIETLKWFLHDRDHSDVEFVHVSQVL